MSRPRIGITIDTTPDDRKYESPMEYAAAIDRAGGLPLLLPYKIDHALIPGYVDLLDGILFSGGNDLDPSAYCDEPWHEKAVKIDPARQRFEFALMAEVEKRRMPALGVCFGSQLMNVYRGGSLVQFLPEQTDLEHRNLPEKRRHDVTVQSDSQIGRAIGKAVLSVNTLHKQGIRTLGRGLKIIATAPDGLIEGIEDPELPLFTAVQWHPEKLIDEPEHLAPFRLLVEKAGVVQAGRSAGHGSDSFDEIPLDSAVIEFDLFCLSCEYNLHMLGVAGRCPECGTPVSESLWINDPVINHERKVALRRTVLRPLARQLKCSEEGLLFVLDAMAQAARADRRPGHRPLTAAEVCQAVRTRINEYFNDRREAEDLLYEWGVRSSEHVGRMVEEMVNAGLIRAGGYELPPAYAGLFNLGNVWDRLK